MNCVDVKHNIKVDIDVTLNNQPVDDVLRKVCEWCHEGLEDTSIIRQDADNNPYLDNTKTWKVQCEYLEGILSRILDELGD